MIEYISITEASTATDTPRSTLKKWCADGRIKGAIKIGNQWCIPHNWTRPTLKRGNPQWSKSKEIAK